MSDFGRVNEQVFPQAFALLPVAMDSIAARALLLAIGLQESRFEYRVQIRGPAHGYWQFEQGGGVKGVLTHPETALKAKGICVARNVPAVAGSVYQAIINDDVLAACFARLLLWTLPGALPAQDQRDKGWDQYVSGWRPGAPHRATWDAFYDQSWLAVLT